MFDVLKTLSSLVQPKRGSGKPHESPTRKIQAKPQASIQQPQSLSIQTDLNAMRKLAEAQAKEIVLEARDEAIRIRKEIEEESRRKIEQVERREQSLGERDRRLLEIENVTQKNKEEIEKIKLEQLSKLERVANLTRDEAKDLIMSAVTDKLKEEIAKEIRQAQEKARDESEEKAREILVDSMRHGATDYVAEYTVSIVKVTDEEMKGRIIGKEGRNIRAFETATGVDVDLDEDGVIRLSCFDPVRREIARVALERLLRDGRVQPGRIEEVVELVKKELEKIMFEEGQKLCHGVGVYNLPTPIVALLGHFKYRFSYGQNMIAHTLEETKIGVALAQEVGADVNVVRLGCLLHDIGKVITDQEGSHVELGVQFLKKYGIPQKVTDSVAQHHEDTPFSSLESVLVYIADAISGSRPGARYENYEEYVKRLKSLEAIAKAKDGVKETFAFQAGRELRVIVDPGRVDDASATIMASQVKEEIEKKLTYPGQIKITVIRELRATEIAK
ncbi:ribonuclease Y [Candidatus Gottesmanbacteria bacterium]|nr:ribonuclease Y [Candidatus Gottesmanbacteria bacterium]